MSPRATKVAKKPAEPRRVYVAILRDGGRFAVLGADTDVRRLRKAFSRINCVIRSFVAEAAMRPGGRA